jgi:hypothetical protein
VRQAMNPAIGIENDKRSKNATPTDARKPG